MKKIMNIKGYDIHPNLLEQKNMTRCQIAHCKSSCCAHGVWLDVTQADAIRQHAEMIAPFLPQDRRDTNKWFDELHVDEKAFPSGQYTGTCTVAASQHPSGRSCVFLRPEDYHCAIQAACVANGLDSWALKPYYCCLFPVVDDYDGDKKTLMLDADNELFAAGGGCHRACADVTQPVFQIYAEEISLVLGGDGYRELCAQTGVMPRC